MLEDNAAIKGPEGAAEAPQDREARPWGLGDYFRVRTIREPALSPDGRLAAFLVDAGREAQDDRITELYVTATDQLAPPHRLTQSTGQLASPAWSPDGRYLAVLAARERPLVWPSPKEPATGGDAPAAKPKPQVWVFDMSRGGDPRCLTDRAEGVVAFEWAPDGQSLVVVSRDPSPDQTRYLLSIRDGRHPGPWVVKRARIKQDGQGYLDDVPTHLFLVALATGETVPLTTGPASEHDPHWSPDGEWVLFRSNRTGQPDLNGRQDLWMIRRDQSAVVRVTQGDVSAGAAAFSPDGKRIVYVSPQNPESGYTIAHVFQVAAAAAVPCDGLESPLGGGFASVGGVVPPLRDGADPVRHARAYPTPEGRTPHMLLTSDAPGPVRSALTWIDSDHVMALLVDHGPSQLVSIGSDADPGIHTLAPGDRVGSIEAYAHRGGVTVVVLNRPDTATELYRVDKDQSLVRLTTLNQAAFQGRQVPHYRWFRFPNPDGDQVEGVVAVPAAGHAPFPLIAIPHGGPGASDAITYRFDHQYWVGLGYAVLLLNYRGSVSYGEEWQAAIRGDWGRREHADLMAGVDFLVAEGIADSQRLFCTGFSYGGVMTNWAVGHTDRFRAAVTEHGMWDYASMFGHGDTDLHWQDGWGLPWQNPEGYRRSSPMTAADNIRTPLLITAGEQDWRCPVAQAEQLYAAVVRRGVPAELVVYPGEHHAWQTRPSRALDRIRRITEWFGRFGGITPADEAEEAAPASQR